MAIIINNITTCHSVYQNASVENTTSIALASLATKKSYFFTNAVPTVTNIVKKPKITPAKFTLSERTISIRTQANTE